MTKNKQFLSPQRLVMIITTTVFSFSSLTTAFFLMGMRALPYFIWAAVFYFIPYALIIADFTSVYKNDSGGLYQWLSDCLTERIAFIAAFLWYCSYFVWMISLFMKLWIPLSLLAVGQDLTKVASPLPVLTTSRLIGLLSILAVCGTLALSSRGFKPISRLLVFSSGLMILLVVISFGSTLLVQFLQPQQLLPHLQSSLQSPETGGQGVTVPSQLSFMIFAITAFGGLDTVASMVDKTGREKRTFPRLIITSSLLIVFCYFAGLLLWSGALDWQQLKKDPSLHLGNLMYGLMNTAGQQLGQALGTGPASAAVLGQLFTRLTALTLLASYIGLISSIFYLPLRVLVQGTPQHYWPAWVRKANQRGIPTNALLVQGGLISFFILAVSWGNPYVTTLYNQLTMMTNISRALPYLLVALAYPAFKRKYNSQGLLPYNLKNPQRFPLLISRSVVLTIALSIASQLCVPFIEKNYAQTISLAMGPLFFGAVGALLYQRFFNKDVAE